MPQDDQCAPLADYITNTKFEGDCQKHQWTNNNLEAVLPTFLKCECINKHLFDLLYLHMHFGRNNNKIMNVEQCVHQCILSSSVRNITSNLVTSKYFLFALAITPLLIRIKQGTCTTDFDKNSHNVPVDIKIKLITVL